MLLPTIKPTRRCSFLNAAWPARNLELIQYYRDRSVWLVEPDQSEAVANPARVSPYPVEESK
jgi:hypothetical protein